MTKELEQLFDSKKAEYNDDPTQEVELAYIGVFNQGLVESIADEVERIVARRDKSKVLIKKIFSIFVEGMNNIRHHGYKVKGESAQGFVILSKKDEGYQITVSNLIETKFVNSLESYLTKLNLRSNEELESAYNERLSIEVARYKGGSGFGLLTARKKSGYPFGFEFFPCDDDRQILSIEIMVDNNVSE